MTKRHSTKQAFLISLVSLLLCFSMLIGTTFAWFTDSVTSANNIITAGNLDVELYHADKGTDGAYVGVDDQTKLFDDIVLWEPGAVVYENFTVKNEGTLSLKYKLSLVKGTMTEVNGRTLDEVIKVAVVPGGFTGDREAAKQLNYTYDLKSSFSLNGSLLADKSETYGIVLYWEPGVNDNDFNVEGDLTISIGVQLSATQLDNESDSFGPEYDAGVTLPDVDGSAVDSVIANANGSATLTSDAAPSAVTNKTTVAAPEGAFNSGDKVEMTVNALNSLFNVSSAGGVVASLDVTLTVNGEKADDLTDGKVYTVTTYISKGLDASRLTVSYTGNDGKAQPTLESYDPATGKLVFTTNHFSNYAVTGSALAYDAKTDTALATVEQVIEATKDENTTVVIPEVNQQVVQNAVQEKIKNDSNLTEEEKNEIIASVSAAKIGDTVYATLDEAFEAAVDGDTIVILSGISTTKTYENNKNITLDLNGKTIACTLSGTGNQNLFNVKGNLTVVNGTITLETTKNQGWNAMSTIFNITAGGVVTLNGVVAENKGGTDMNFVAHLNNWGKATLNVNNSTLKATYVAVRVFNSGYDMNTVVIENSTVTSTGNAAFWVHNYTAADFGTQEKADAQAKLLNFTFNNVTFGAKKAAFRLGMTNAEYYTADGSQVVSTADELVAALEAKKDVVFANDIKIDPANMSNAYGKTGINVKNGQTIDGNGYTLNIKGAGGTWDSGINTTGGLIKNITITGSFRGIFINHNSEHSEKVVLENVVIGGNGTVYTISCDQGKYQGIEATNCTFNGWTSFAKTAGEAKFVNCSFGEGSGYAYCRPYSNTEFVNCTFSEGYAVDTTRATVTFTDCENPAK